MSESSRVDIAVVGGGLVGTPVAIMLARLGWSVALLEQHNKQTSNNNGANAQGRGKGFTALSAATVDALQTHQLWDKASVDACAIRQVHVSHKGYFGSTVIDSESYSLQALGQVVDNAAFLASFETALQSSSVIRFDGASVNQVHYHQDVADVHYQRDNQSRSLQCRLVIAVDGVSSSLREAAGITTRHTDYDQVGVLGVVKLSQAHEEVAYERFTPSGPLALLPRPNNQASFVYCIGPDQREAMAAMNHVDFLAELQRAFGYRLGQFLSVGPRFFTPLVRIEATRQVGPRLLLMGNAMRLLHPVAGQGYNLAVRDVVGLLNTLKDTQSDPGDANALSAFAQSRQADHKAVVRMTDALARTFRGSAAPIAHLRALGLLGLDRIPVLKKQFARHSMGHR